MGLVKGKLRRNHTIPVSERALLQRINRKLLDENRKVIKTRGALAIAKVGEYHEIDTRLSALIGRDINLELYGRKLGVLAQWEQITKEEE